MSRPESTGNQGDDVPEFGARSPQEQWRSQRADGPVVIIDATPTVLGWDEVQAVLRDPTTFTSDVHAAGMGNSRPAIPLQVNRPEHARYRRLLHPPFAAERISRLIPDARAIAGALIDAFKDQGRCDVAGDYIRPYILQVFLRFAGIAAVHGHEVSCIVDDIIRPSGTDEQRARLRSSAVQRSYELLERVIDDRVANPADDVISYLLSVDLDGRRLSQTELLDIGFVLLVAGIHSTSDALGCCFAFLARHPTHRRELVANPETFPTAINELLRWESPVTAVPRCVKSATSLGGVDLDAQQIVHVVLASANTDEDHVENAFEVNLRRAPNPHVAFGAGIHRCLGIHLAQMEMLVALEEWHRKIPDYALADESHGQVSRRHYVRNVQQLTLEWRHCA